MQGDLCIQIFSISCRANASLWVAIESLEEVLYTLIPSIWISFLAGTQCSAVRVLGCP